MTLQRPNASSDFRVKNHTVAVNTALAADADLAELVVWRAPTGIKVVRASLLPQVASAGIDGSNTSAWVVRSGVAGTTVASVTKTTNFAANTEVTMTVDSTVEIAQGTLITLQVTNGTAADLDGITYLTIDYITDGLVDP